MCMVWTVPFMKGISMLVLTRKPGERILIGEDIRVTVVRIGPNTVRLGIEAPRGVNIVRSEIILEIADEQENEAKEEHENQGAEDQVERHPPEVEKRPVPTSDGHPVP